MSNLPAWSGRHKKSRKPAHKRRLSFFMPRALSLSGSEIARQLGVSKSGVNDFLRAFDKRESLSYPLPHGITNYGIAELVYGSVPGSGGRNKNIKVALST